MTILPEHYNYVRTFYCRELFRLDGTGKWCRVNGQSDPPLHWQINEWVREDRVQLTVVQSPTIQLLKDEEDSREFLLALTAMYIPPVEGEVDEFGEERPVKVFGPDRELGEVVQSTEPGGEEGVPSVSPTEDS